MSTPTVIRSATIGSDIVQVITYFENYAFRACLQVYVVYDNGRTSLQYSMPYSDEPQAVEAFDAAVANQVVERAFAEEDA